MLLAFSREGLIHVKLKNGEIEVLDTYRVNFAQALSKRKDNLVQLLVSNSSRQLLTALILAVATRVEAVRPDRSYPRKIKPAKLHPFHPNYKCCLS